MDKVNVLVVSRHRFHKTYLDDILAVDARVSAKDGLKQFISELREKGIRDPFADILEGEVLPGYSDAEEDMDTLLADAEVIFGALKLPENLLSRAPKLKWIHINDAGLERYFSTGIFEGNVLITNGKGTNSLPVAEHIMGFVFMLAKNAPLLLRNKNEKLYDRFNTMELNKRTMGIIGFGAIGRELARLAKGIGMRVIAIRRSAEKKEEGVLGVDKIYPTSNLSEMLSESDFVAIACSLTPETRGLIGEKEFQAMKPTAYLINAARGPIVNQSALIASLKNGSLAGAGLDVFETEPLPQDNELWDLPNVIISPHMAGSTDTRSQRLVGLFCENLKRYLSGEELLNVVTSQQTQRGY